MEIKKDLKTEAIDWAKKQEQHLRILAMGCGLEAIMARDRLRRISELDGKGYENAATAGYEVHVLGEGDLI